MAINGDDSENYSDASLDGDDIEWGDVEWDDIEAEASRQQTQRSVASPSKPPQSHVKRPFKPPTFTRPSPQISTPAVQRPEPHADENVSEEMVVDLGDQVGGPIQLPGAASTGIGLGQDQPVQQGAQDSYNTTGLQYGGLSVHDQNYHIDTVNNGYDETDTGSNGIPQSSVEQESRPMVYDLLDQQRETTSLQTRVHQLEQELKDAQERINVKTGEVSILRSNLEKEKQEHGQQIKRAKQMQAEALAQTKAKLDKIKADNQRMETNNLFLQHDLDSQAQKSRALKKSSKDGLGIRPRPGSPTTPTKKQRTLPTRPHRDGFDDGDIMMSPGGKSRPVTPKEGKKRKRAVIDQSPVRALDFDEPMLPPESQPKEMAPQAPQIDPAVFARIAKGDARYEFLQQILNHRPQEGHGRFFEELTLHSFPSAPGIKLSSIVYDDLFNVPFNENQESFPLRFCNILLSLWEQCREETHYGPLYLLVEAIQYTLALEPMSTTHVLAERILGLVQPMLELVAMPLVRAQQKLISIAKRDSALLLQLRKDIEIQNCLYLVFDVALSCATDPNAITAFWRRTQHDFILMMLNKAIPLECISLTLRIFNTSILPTSFSHIVDEHTIGERETKEAAIVSRLTNLLSEKPERSPEDSNRNIPYPASHIAFLRIQVLQTLALITLHPPGSSALARHPDAIAQLIRFLHRSINNMYSYTLPTHSQTTTAVNLTVRILHALLTRHEETIDMKDKLKNVPGSSHMYMVALTRIAFSDGLVLDVGIEEEVAGMAQELVELKLTPEEAEGIVAVYRSERTSAGGGI